MRDFLTGLFQAQNIPEGSKEGLPYWIFWLLLLVIVLLLTFIFLRDKDLRHRLDSFFSGLKKRFIKLRLQSMLKKEKQKQEGFITDLGKTSWENNLKVEGGDVIKTRLGELEAKLSDLNRSCRDISEKIQELNHDLAEFRRSQDKKRQGIEDEKIPFQESLDGIRTQEKEIAAEVSRLQTEREETVQELNRLRKPDPSPEMTGKSSGEPVRRITALEKKLKGTDEEIERLVNKKTELDQISEKDREEIESLDHKIKSLHEETRSETKILQKDIKEKEKNLAKLQERIQAVEQDKMPLFNSLGRMMDEHHDSTPELASFYSKINRTRRRIEDIEKQIRELD